MRSTTTWRRSPDLRKICSTPTPTSARAARPRCSSVFQTARRRFSSARKWCQGASLSEGSARWGALCRHLFGILVVLERKLWSERCFENGVMKLGANSPPSVRRLRLPPHGARCRVRTNCGQFSGKRPSADRTPSGKPASSSIKVAFRLQRTGAAAAAELPTTISPAISTPAFTASSFPELSGIRSLSWTARSSTTQALSLPSWSPTPQLTVTSCSACFRLLGYSFSPRLSDVGSARFWRIDGAANYGPLNGIARNRINTEKIIEHWPDILRVAGSLLLGKENSWRTVTKVFVPILPRVRFRANAPAGPSKAVSDCQLTVSDCQLTSVEHKRNAA